MGGKKLPTASDLAQPSAEDACSHPGCLTLIEEEHALQLELCDLLETIADGLPAELDKALALAAIGTLRGAVPAHTRLEEEGLFPLLRRRLKPSDPVIQALRCLESEHDGDTGLLSEVVDALKLAVQSPTVERAETLGFVLRGFFESQRRHIYWEEQIVLPAAHSVLTGADIADLEAWITRADHPRCSAHNRQALREARLRTLRTRSAAGAGARAANGSKGSAA